VEECIGYRATFDDLTVGSTRSAADYMTEHGNELNFLVQLLLFTVDTVQLEMNATPKLARRVRADRGPVRSTVLHMHRDA
jgi:hypothetical protein